MRGNIADNYDVESYGNEKGGIQFRGKYESKK